MSGLASGLLHPLLVPAHVLALTALATCIGRQAGPARLAAGIAFAAGVAGGLTAIALATRPASAVDWLLAASLLAGTFSAAALPLPTSAIAVLAAWTGASLGMDSPPQAISLAVATLTLIGTGIGACLALAMATVVTGLLVRAWRGLAVRVLGSWCAASAIMVLAVRFARGLMLG